ncbi:MAG: glycoside hydrolase family 3 C-terminal domain-containing protein, partial [Gemmatimonadaceae bacterium]|nr:glycoside hydrolase family 3 C-terminal domain-containing protein [Gemmatimonadaceae bacterium]
AAATAGATVLARTEASTATAAAHAFAAGLDVIFQSSYPEHRPYLQAIRDGVVPEATLDSAVLRVLRLKFALGLFDESPISPDSAAAAANDPAHRQLAREAATASVVLLRNASRRGRTVDSLAPRTLPFAAGTRRIAVIGPDADTVRLGGYSGPGVDPVSIAAAIRARAGRGAQVRVVRGASRAIHTHRVVPATLLESVIDGRRQTGLQASYWDNPWLQGEPRVRRVDATIDFRWTLGSPARELPYDWYSARWTGTLIVPPEGITRLGVDGNDGVRIWLDGTLVLDAWEKRSAGVQLAAVRLAAGTRHELKVEYTERTGNARVSLVYDAPRVPSPDAEIAAAVAAARASEAAVLVVGIEEGEFRDRARLSLPGHQEALIRAVAATGTPTTVVIVGGSAVTMSRWIDSVGAVLMAWYPGEDGGPAIAGLLFGDASPSGRLPITFPLEEGQLPLTYDHKPTGRGDDYVDLTGQPLFPFGYGLSYTQFAYDQLRITTTGRGDSTRVTVRARVRNTGTRAGKEVVQLYLRDVLTSVAQPLIALKGVAPVTLSPGEATDVTFVLTAEHLRLLDASMHWVVERGEFRVMVGASSRDIRLRDTFVVQ